MKRRHIILPLALAALSVQAVRKNQRRARLATARLPERPHDPAARLDVLIIGAGLSGIGAARHLLAECPGKSFALLEARHAIGGTWDLFRYPGVRSDSDVYTLGYSFKPWTGDKSIADGPDIRQYIQDASDEAGITPHIRFGHRVRRAEWSSERQLWTVTAEREDGETVTFQTKFLFLCSGYYSYAEGHRPSFPGEETFRGEIVHPQFWPENLDYAGKRVVVIGSGATAVTLVPALAQAAAHVTMLQRSPSYIAVQPLIDQTALKIRRALPAQAAHRLIRWRNILVNMLQFGVARQLPQVFSQELLKVAGQHVGEGFEARHFTPDYRPWDQRVCAVPDGDLFTAMREGKASVVTDTIARFMPDGIRLGSGQELKADLIVTATGLKMNVLGDIGFSVDGQPFDPARALVYKGMMLGGLPNCAYAFGYTNAAWTLKAELTQAFVCRLLNHMERQHLGVVVPQADPSVQERPLLNFSSGYVTRAAALLPKQGSKRPWQVYQNYLQDKAAIEYSPLNDGTLRFTAARG
ncbi:MAG: NAD(P)/FAD-dependent oxidoreductase [Deinococcus sp.]|uniref:flavin-containing monooxygenase n=1 Tax=Deinococcus sp. TaxID=47478 RepID=UPI0026DBBD9C|nr:NAD(P)/FAD-dependent oxidoreductase [Deinococcus sp.]MDO4245003.1 NAD(P)/FAD-dependent oxidoreductase [Deinococcus sp.]